VTDSIFEAKLGEHKRSGIISMSKLFADLKSDKPASAKGETDIPLPKSAPSRSRDAAHAVKSVDRDVPIDRDRVIRRLYGVMHNTLDYGPIKNALAENKWKLTDRDLAALGSLSDRLLGKILPCLLYGSQPRDSVFNDITP
jgi:hypothetical protein